MMGNRTSSLASYQSLGAREQYFYTDEEKTALFVQGIASIKSVLEISQQSGVGPTSVPALVRMIFQDNVQDKDIQTIREAIRPTYGIGTHHISATGTKLLACLALTQDKGCIDANGYLRADYTKSVIRGWFSNSDAVLLDDSALTHMRMDVNDKDKDGNARLILGKNRLSAVNLYASGKIAETIDRNCQSAQLGQRPMKLTLSTRPQAIKQAQFREAVLGDLHGNSLMLLHQLVQLGMLEVNPPGDRWDELVTKINNNDITGFRDLLPRALSMKPLSGNLVLLGDLLADRSSNDWFTLSIIDFLHEKDHSFDIILSNHDLAFVEYFLVNQGKAKNEDYAHRGKAFEHDVSPCASLEKLNKVLNHNPDLREEFVGMATNYMQHLRFLECSDDQRSLYSHGVVNENMIADMLWSAGKESAEQESLGIKEKTRIINAWFRAKALGSIEQFQDFFGSQNTGQFISTNFHDNPFYMALWNRGPLPDKFMEGPDHKYCNAELPSGVVQVVHGHTENMRTAYDNQQTLNAQLGKLYKQLSKAAPADKMQTWISQGLQLFIDLASTSVLPEDFGELFTLFLHKASLLAEQDQAPDLKKKIDDFFKQCETYPTNRAGWFSQYTSNDPNDVLMIEKKRQNEKDPSKAT